MNKSKITVMLTVLIVAIACFVMPMVHAEDLTTADGLTYQTNYNNDGVIITKAPSGAESVTIPDEIDGLPVTSIGGNAFLNCYETLKTITIPSAIEAQLSASDFSICHVLENINVTGNDGAYSSGDGVLFKNSDSGKTLVAYPRGKAAQTYEIPTDVTVLGSSAFMNAPLKQIKVPSSVSQMDSYMFAYSTVLEKADLSEYKGSISFNTFYACSQLSEVILPDDMKAVSGSMFKDCTSLKSIDIPESVKLISHSAFEGSGLESIHISANVSMIDTTAFTNCNSLASITVDSANKNYKAVNDVVYDTYGTMIYLYPKTKADLEILDTVEDLPDYFMKDNATLTSFDLPSSLKSVSTGAFMKTSIETVVIPQNVKAIESTAFYGCENLSSVQLNAGLTTIEYEAFENCKNLKSVTIPATVTLIQNNAFDADVLEEICGYNDTTAQEYAEKFNIPFTSLGDVPINIVTVKNTQELLTAINPYTKIIMEDGVYETEEPIVINQLTGLTIRAKNTGKAEILSYDGYNTVIDIKNSKDITLSGLILGHKSLEYQSGCGSDEYSSGYVVYAYNSDGINLTQCDLYGCGTIATYLSRVNNFLAKGCILRDCKENIATVYSSYDEGENIVYDDCVFSGNAYDENYANYVPAIIGYDTTDIQFNNCIFINNYSTSLSSVEANYPRTDCMEYNNVWQGQTPKSNGICLNGITWQIAEENGENVLKLGYPIELDSDYSIESASGEVLSYSLSSIPWKGLSYTKVDCAEGVVYDIENMDTTGAYGDVEAKAYGFNVAANKISADVTLENNSGENRVFTIYLAVYDNGGKLINLSAKNVHIGESAEETIISDCDDAYAYARVYFFGGDNRVTPMCNVLDTRN